MNYKMRIAGYGAQYSIFVGKKEQIAYWIKQFKLEHSDENEMYDEEYYGEAIVQKHGGFIDLADITVEDEDENVIYISNITDDGIAIEEEVDDDFELKEDEYKLFLIENVKGDVFEGEMELDEFDPKKIKAILNSNEYGEFYTGIIYDGEEVEPWGGDTFVTDLYMVVYDSKGQQIDTDEFVIES